MRELCARRARAASLGPTLEWRPKEDRPRRCCFQGEERAGEERAVTAGGEGSPAELEGGGQ